MVTFIKLQRVFKLKYFLEQPLKFVSCDTVLRNLECAAKWYQKTFNNTEKNVFLIFPTLFSHVALSMQRQQYKTFPFK